MSVHSSEQQARNSATSSKSMFIPPMRDKYPAVPMNRSIPANLQPADNTALTSEKLLPLSASLRVQNERPKVKFNDTVMQITLPVSRCLIFLIT